MNQQRLSALMAVMVAASATLFASSVLASDIYRYVDSDGNVYYVDRPSGEQTEQRLSIKSKRSAYQPAQARADSRNDRDDAAPQATDAAGEAPAKKSTRAEKKAARRERDQQCQSYRDSLETLSSAPRLYRENEDGERTYLDESESQAARDKVAGLIRENCS